MPEIHIAERRGQQCRNQRYSAACQLFAHGVQQNAAPGHAHSRRDLNAGHTIAKKADEQRIIPHSQRAVLRKGVAKQHRPMRHLECSLKHHAIVMGVTAIQAEI